MKHLSIVLLVVFCFSCKKKESPKPPESAKLVFPQKNSECTTGSDTGTDTNMVEFKWEKALNTDSYVISVTNLNTNITQTETTSAVSKKIPLQKGTPYSWVVNSKNASVLQAAASETWRFYNAGFETSHAPFPAEIIAPKFGEVLSMDISNEVSLNWAGSDIDDDIETYELYFSTVNPPNNLIDTATAETSNVTVERGLHYYWKVITIDSEGNTSDSGIFNFSVR